jgi:hypothetical protein
MAGWFSMAGLFYFCGCVVYGRALTAAGLVFSSGGLLFKMDPELDVKTGLVRNNIPYTSYMHIA